MGSILLFFRTWRIVSWLAGWSGSAGNRWTDPALVAPFVVDVCHAGWLFLFIAVCASVSYQVAFVCTGDEAGKDAAIATGEMATSYHMHSDERLDASRSSPTRLAYA
jgi:hypothetical protein